MKRRMICVLLSLLFMPCIGLFSACGKQEKAGCRYEIKAEYVPENSAVRASQKVVFENNTSNCLERLDFNLYANAYKKEASCLPVPPSAQLEGYYQGESYGGMEITSVVGGKGWEVCGEEENLLCVYLEEPLYPDEKITLDISFITRLAKVNYRTGEGERSVNLGNFYPQLCAYQNGFIPCSFERVGEPFLSECADYFVKLSLPKEYAVVASGSLVKENVLENNKAVEYEAKNHRAFSLILSEEFVLKEFTFGEIKVNYACFKEETKEEIFSAKDTLEKAFRFFENTLGKYPYEELSIARSSLCKGVWGSGSLCVLNEKSKEEELVFALAKLFLGGVVGNDSLNEAWQGEGLAAYSTALFFDAENRFSIEKSVRDCLEEYRGFYKTYSALKGEADGRMSRPLKEYENEFEYRAVSVDKAVVMFDLLRLSVGEKRFFAGLKRYYRENAFSIALAENLIGSFEKTGADVAGFFHSFLSGEAIL